jgi:hypothetical protein
MVAQDQKRVPKVVIAARVPPFVDKELNRLWKRLKCKSKSALTGKIVEKWIRGVLSGAHGVEL